MHALIDRLPLVLLGIALMATPCTVSAQDERTAPVPLPEVRHGHCLERLSDGSLLCFGGFGRGARPRDRGSCAVWKLAPKADAWKRLRDLPYPMAFATSVVWDGRVHAIGDGVLRYAASEDRWEEVLARGHLPRSHLAAAADARGIVIVGGVGPLSGRTRRLDPTSGKLHVLPDLPGHREGDHFHLAASLDGKVHVIGGFCGKPAELRSTHHVLDGERWRRLPDAPQPLWRKFTASAVDADRLLVFSSEFGLAFDAQKGTWQDLPTWGIRPGRGPLAMAAATAHEGEVIVIGGMAAPTRGRVALRFLSERRAWSGGIH